MRWTVVPLLSRQPSYSLLFSSLICFSLFLSLHLFDYKLNCTILNFCADWICLSWSFTLATASDPYQSLMWVHLSLPKGLTLHTLVCILIHLVHKQKKISETIIADVTTECSPCLGSGAQHAVHYLYVTRSRRHVEQLWPLSWFAISCKNVSSTTWFW